MQIPQDNEDWGNDIKMYTLDSVQKSTIEPSWYNEIRPYLELGTFPSKL